MNRFEARMVAEELCRLQDKDYRKDDFLTAGELAKKLKVSESLIRKNGTKLPHVKMGAAIRYPLNKVVDRLEKKHGQL
nr:hypothetical protein [uncultured Prevotella sp.]